MKLSEIRNSCLKSEINLRHRVEYFLSEIEAKKNLNIFISVLGEQALAQADSLHKKINSGKNVGKLAGIIVGVKDILNLKGSRTTCGSGILSNYKSVYDATVIEKLRLEDAIFIGKLNMDEFSMGSSSETSFFGPVKNPLNPHYVPGGSSGGSAAAVAAELCDISLGTDTGGSIRQPASFTGVVGLKPTYGKVSRYGMIAFASSFDQIGPLARSVDDAAYMLEIIAGHDPKDSTSVNTPVDAYTKYLKRDIKKIRFGIANEFFSQGLDPAIREIIENQIDEIRKVGGIIKTIKLPSIKYAVAAYYIIANAEASSNLARFDGVRFGLRDKEAGTLSEMYRITRSGGFGEEVKRRIMLGTFALSTGFYDAYNKKAPKVRNIIMQDFNNAFKDVDIILSPTTPTLPFELCKNTDEPLTMYLNDVYTVPANLAGLCGISIPVRNIDGLPVGMQMIADYMREDLLIQCADVLEDIINYKRNTVDGR